MHKSIRFLLLAALGAIVLSGCGSALHQSFANPRVENEIWTAEQQYFLDKLENFCFDRRWDEAPFKTGEDRAPGGMREYRLWGRIGEEDIKPDAYDERMGLTCKLVANIPFWKASLRSDDYRSVRSSPWWNGHRRQVFRGLIEQRYGVLQSATLPRIDRFDGEILLLRDGETLLEITHFPKNSGTAVKVHRSRAVPAEAVADPDELPEGAEFKRFYQRVGESFRKLEVYHYERIAEELPLNQVLDLDQLTPEAVVELDEQRRNLTEAELGRLRNQVAYNLERMERDVRMATGRYESDVQHRRQMAEFRRKREAERKAANQALLREVVTGLYSASAQTQSGGSYGVSSSTASGSSAPAGDLYSPQVPWASIHEQAARARQQIQANHDAEQARQRAAASAGAVTPTPSRTGTAATSSSRTSSGSSTSPDAPVASRTSSKPDSADRDQTESNSKREPRRIYEPAPEVIVGTTDTYFGDRDMAIFYARLGAANDIDDICWDKGGRSDRPTSADIRAGNVPPRWSMGNPDCKQNSNGKWKCRTRVSGTCYRMQ